MGQSIFRTQHNACYDAGVSNNMPTLRNSLWSALWFILGSWLRFATPLDRLQFVIFNYVNWSVTAPYNLKNRTCSISEIDPTSFLLYAFMSLSKWMVNVTDKSSTVPSCEISSSLYSRNLVHIYIYVCRPYSLAVRENLIPSIFCFLNDISHPPLFFFLSLTTHVHEYTSICHFSLSQSKIMLKVV